MEKSKVVNFNRGVPASETLPTQKITESCVAILKEDGKTILQYYSAQGYSPLRELLAEQVGHHISKDQILLGNGSLQILNIITNVLLKPGDTVLVESPTYDRAITAFSRRGAEVIGVPLEQNGPDLTSFQKIVQETNPKLFYTIPDFHNPTGITTTEGKRRKIVAIAEENDLNVVENTLYRALRYYGKDKPSFFDLNQEIVLHISSFSKILSPGLRVGWVAANSSVMNELATYAEDTYITSNLLSQGIVYKLMIESWLGENIEHLKTLYKPRLKATLRSIEEYLPDVDYSKPNGGFFVGIWFPRGVDIKEVSRKAKASGVILSESSGFFPDHQPNGFLRIPFCAVTKEEIEEGIKKLSKIYQTCKRS